MVAVPKPTPRRLEKARRKRQWVKDRKRSREIRYKRDGGCCVECGRPVKLNITDEGADWYNVANIHEIKPRSLGGDPLNPDEQKTTCSDCHKKEHRL